MKKAELKTINENLIEAHTQTQNAWALVRVLAHAAQNKEPPPPWAVRDTCAAIEEILANVSGLLYQSGQTIEGGL
jgi:hypothetical protein